MAPGSVRTRQCGLAAWRQVVSKVLALLAVLAAAIPCVQGADFGAARPAAPFQVSRQSIYIPMSDGTRLAADIFRPSLGGKPVAGSFPVVLHHLAARPPKGSALDDYRSLRPTAQFLQLAGYGYVYVAVERRGMGASFGVRRGYHDRNEARDARELTEWAAAQAWSNGKVGVHGCSNTGDAAMHFLTNASPKLKAVFAGCFNWDKYSGGLRGGILANWGTGPQSSFEQDMKATPVDGDDERVLLRQAALQHQANTPLLDLWAGMPYRDSVSPLTQSAFWQEGSIGTYLEQVRASRVPVYVQGGWLDDFRGQGPITYANLTQPRKLLIGPWGHCEYDGFDIYAEALRFFDYWLKDIKNGVMEEPPIHYYTMNAPAGSEWRSAEQWPPPSATVVSYFFKKDPDGSQRSHLLDRQAPQAGPGKLSFTVDYAVACSKGTGLGPTCPQDDKGLTFTTARLTEDMELTGFPIVSLWASFSQADGPIFAYLEDLAPDNSIAMVSEGRLKASLRALSPAPYAYLGLPWHSYAQADARPLSPGLPENLVFDLLPISYVFKSGHRLRMTITGADPREKLRKEFAPAPRWSIHVGAAFPTKIDLPVVAK